MGYEKHYRLRKNEYEITEAKDVRCGSFGRFTDQVILTNQRIIWQKYILGNFDEKVEYQLEKLEIGPNGIPKVYASVGKKGEKILELHFKKKPQPLIVYFKSNVAVERWVEKIYALFLEKMQIEIADNPKDQRIILPKNTVICSKCGATLIDPGTFCSKCGEKIENVIPENTCPICGYELKVGAKFCSHCGNSFADKQKAHEERENRLEVPVSSDTKKVNPAPRGNSDGEGKFVRVNETASNNRHNSYDGINAKIFGLWNRLNLFTKIVTIGLGITILLLLGAVFSHKGLPFFITAIQIVGFTVAYLMHKEYIKSPYVALKYVILSISIILIGLNILSYNVGKDKAKSEQSVGNQTQSTQYDIAKEPSENDKASNNFTIEKDSQYAYMCSEADVYIARAISDSIIKIEHWNKNWLPEKKMSFYEEVGSYEINDPANGFSWIDDEHTAFNFIFSDKNVSKVKKSASHVFTISANDSDENKGTAYDKRIACYTYTNDDWHKYRAVPLTDELIKVECWSRSSSVGNFLFGYDWELIDINNNELDFKWTDDEHTSFSINAQDSDNSYNWKEKNFTIFELEDRNYKYNNVLLYLDRFEVEEDEINVPDSASSYKYGDYEDVKAKLTAAGFTNIKTSILYDIIWEVTPVGEVDSVSIDGIKNFEQGEVFKKDSEVIITYHMKWEDDPTRKQEETRLEEQKTSQPDITTQTSKTAGDIYDYACYKKSSDNTVYYMLDEDTHTFVTFLDYESSALEGTYSGSLNKGFTLEYTSDWKEKLEFVGATVTLTDVDGYDYKFTRMTGTEADKIYKQKIKSTYNAD